MEIFANKHPLIKGAGAIFLPFSDVVNPRHFIVHLRCNLHYVLSKYERNGFPGACSLTIEYLILSVIGLLIPKSAHTVPT